ncbi:MAG: BREX-1 system adenine-specific DNA-methyltransferase PglX [Gammaproteobacteria bacterium]|nr:BREX-1 system adenine-specific DNA-methyltransferase PglX [Gammaproteobacteria bacterium]MBT4449492.1 BREX-1 system adenine-specific DNA-methyltransferase PglX [Gammaproteobacteria bacterium]MBT7209299.1 BREX-1 system adenine-specific DNA-methyltransferase PglX [Gammaproteobacteria bacterium]
METAQLKKFAQYARRNLIESVGNKLEQVIDGDSPARRESPKAIADLEKAIQTTDKEQVIDKTAYIWFNRFCALRFMDVNRYNRISVISPVDGQIQPEILAEAKAGLIDETSVDAPTREKVTNLLNGTATSRDPQTEAYRLLIVAVCNDYHRIMPYLFQRIEDYTELLMPDDLLSENSILEYTRQAMTIEACDSVESIGWLYQFYISEKKDDVFAGLKKNIKVTPENIPAATQLFTPHWIVRYLVENSLGRLWMLNNPDSKVIEQMDYYIKPVDDNAEQEYLKIQSPEELKICDPACGSGHMLTYAYDLLYAIYLDKGYDSTEIPEKILTKNLYGIEIDERAAELAAFALSMKAMKGNPLDDSNNRRRFFRNPIKPNICRLENVSFTEDDLDEYINFAGRDLFTQDLSATLKQFEEADNFGSLIQPELKNVDDVREVLNAKDVSSELFLAPTHQGVLKVLDQADFLSPKYHVVIANPPYMGGKGMNGRLSKWLKENFPEAKSDLFSAFMLRNVKLTLPKGQLGFMSPFVWMFIPSYENLRKFILKKYTISSLIQLEYSGFEGATVPICAFTIINSYERNVTGGYIRLSDFKGSKNQSPKTLEAIRDKSLNWFYWSKQENFLVIPGAPIAYWASESVFSLFKSGMSLGDVSKPRTGLNTTDNATFLRSWNEVSFNNINLSAKVISDSENALETWYPFQKGGEFRKWYGNNEYVVNWKNNGNDIREITKDCSGGRVLSPEFYFNEGVCWSTISSSDFSARYFPTGFIFSNAAGGIFPDQFDVAELTALMNSMIPNYLFNLMNPTLNYSSGLIARCPIVKFSVNKTIVSQAIDISKKDWDSFETSWEFQGLPLLDMSFHSNNIKKTYQRMVDHWQKLIQSLKSLECKNNQIFITAYGLQNEITADVAVGRVSLKYNPYYRYGDKKNDMELENLLLADTMREFISYAVGCMFGRYSLDKEGLVIANQGETLADYLKQIPRPQFEPDEANVIPLIDLELERGKQDDWFEDDISERFKVFLKVTFGTEHYDENLRFIEESIGKDIKKFFLKDFYTDHIKRYKKRPIYWLFSSPKGSFNALIYMHRYRSDTVSVVLNDYLREFATKLVARKESYEQTSISMDASQSDKTKALKAIDKINKVQQEIKDYERDILYPLAGQNIEIDLDDGVKHNYPLFGKALKKVTGLS